VTYFLRIAGGTLCLFLLAVLPPGVCAQAAPKRISVDEAVDLAIRNNLLLETARIGTDIKRRKTDLVWNQFLPSLSVNGILSRDNWSNSSSGLMAVPETGFPMAMNGISGRLNPNVFALDPITLPQWHVTGAFTATLDFSFALVEGIRSYRLDYEAGLLTLDKARLQTEQGIRKMYNSILLLEANAALLDESFGNARRQADIAEANYRAGLAPRLSWLQAQVGVENMRPTINDMENNLRNLKGNFALILGLPFDAALELEPVIMGSSFIPPDTAEFISRSAGKPDILELQANIITLQSQRKALSLQQHTPYLRLGWTLSSLFNPTLDPFKESWFTTDNWNGGGNFSVTLGMSFNSLFGFTKEGQQLRDMEANLQIQSIRLAQMIRETELEIFSKINSLEKTRTTAEAQQAAVDLAELSYTLTEEAYRAGLQDFHAVQNAAFALNQARVQLLTQQFNFLNDLIDLEYSIGVPFGTLGSGRTINNGSVR
jgi:outer membrane protein TolC